MFVLLNNIFFFLFIASILKLFIEVRFNFCDLNFLLLTFDLIVIFTIELTVFNFKNLFFFGLGAGLGTFLIQTSTILLAYIKFLNLVGGFLIFLVVVLAGFLVMHTSTTLFEIDIFENLTFLVIVFFVVVLFLLKILLLFLLILRVKSLFFITDKFWNFFLFFLELLIMLLLFELLFLTFIDLFLKFFLSKEFICF